MEELIEYIKNLGAKEPEQHTQPITRLVLKLLAEQRGTPKRFYLMKKERLSQLHCCTESAVIMHFPLPMGLEEIAAAANLITAGVPVISMDYILIPEPLIELKSAEL